MNVIESTPNVIDVIAEEFVERYRRGERPAISEYEDRYPEQVEAIRELFPALVVMERLKPESKPAPTSSQAECASEVASLGRLGDYRIVREIGRGGMGIVYEAVQESLGRKVALKVLPKQLVGDESRQTRFDREARAVARLHHSNIVPVFGVGKESGLHYYAMQYIHGLGLDEVLRELRRLKSPGDEPSSAKLGSPQPAVKEPRQAVTLTLTQALITGQFEADADDSKRQTPSDQPVNGSGGNCDTAKGRLSQTLRLSDSFALPGGSSSGKGSSGRGSLFHSVARLGVQVGQALHYAHEQGVLHRDVKPSNLLLDTRGTVWVTDFGLAKSEDHQDLTQTGDVLGTLRYMAPEMFSGKADRRSDVYSLGLTLYELLVLRPGFDEPDRGRLIRLVLNESPPRLRNLDPSIPRDLETILHKAIDRESSHRYASAQDLADDLQRYLNDEPIRARRVWLATRFSRWCKRNPAVAGLTSAIAILLLIATGTSLAAAIIFQNMASDNSKLAGDLKKALGEAQKNLTEVKKQEQLAQTNLGLATAEQKRAEGNLDLALKALDAVYLDAIGTEKLLGEPVQFPDGEGVMAPTRARLTDLEKELLKRGLAFYDQFAQQNATSPRAAPQTAQAYYRVAMLQAGLGELHAAAESYRASLTRFESLTKKEPQNAEHWRQLAEAHAGLAWTFDSWNEAKASLQNSRGCLSEAIARDPKNVALRMRRMDLAKWLNDPQTEDAECDAILKLAPDDVGVLLKATMFLFCRGASSNAKHRENVARAREYSQRALALAPNNPECHLRRAETLANGEVIMYADGRIRRESDSNDPGSHLRIDSEAALTHVARALELSPNSDEAYYIRAKVLENLGRFNEAIVDIDKAISLAPGRIDLRAARGFLLFNWGKFSEAETAYKEVLKEQPLHDRACENIGLCMMNMGRLDEAKQWITKSLEIKPSAWYRHKRLADIHVKQANYAAALASMRTALEIRPDDLSTLYYPFMGQEVPEDAEFRKGLIALAAWAVSHAADRGEALANRGTLFRQMREFALAEKDLAEASAQFPNNLSVRQSWASLAMAQGDWEKAIERYDSAISLVPGAWVSWSNRSVAHLRLRQYDAAINDANRALELHPENDRPFLIRAACYFSQGEFAKSLADLRSAQKLAPQPPARLTMPDGVSASLVAQCPDEAFREGVLQLARDSAAKTPKLRFARAWLAA